MKRSFLGFCVLSCVLCCINVFQTLKAEPNSTFVQRQKRLHEELRQHQVGKMSPKEKSLESKMAGLERSIKALTKRVEALEKK
jgi:hypothetical protein